MRLLFDFEEVTFTEFGIGVDRNSGRTYFAIPVDAGVQDVLLKMASDTWGFMKEQTDIPDNYQPSEKYASTEYLILAIENEMATSIRKLHEASVHP